jgi:N-acetylglucosamine-6-sulfatase
MVKNIAAAPTLLDAAGLPQPTNPTMDGRSFLPLLEGKATAWRDHILYEYHWEWNFPATPTLFAIRTDRYKYIYHYGLWDLNAFYDLETDPLERHNLIRVPAYQTRIDELKKQLFDELEASGGLNIPVRGPIGTQYYDRKLQR